MAQLDSTIRAFVSGEEGAAMVEYALLLALIALVAMASVALLGGAVRDKLPSATTCLSDQSNCPSS